MGYQTLAQLTYRFFFKNGIAQPMDAHRSSIYYPFLKRRRFIVNRITQEWKHLLRSGFHHHVAKIGTHNNNTPWRPQYAMKISKKLQVILYVFTAKNVNLFLKIVFVITMWYINFFSINTERARLNLYTSGGFEMKQWHR